MFIKSELLRFHSIYRVTRCTLNICVDFKRILPKKTFHTIAILDSFFCHNSSSKDKDLLRMWTFCITNMYWH